MKLQIETPLGAEAFSEYPELPPLVVQLLYNRKVFSQKEIDHFLSNEYHRLHDPYIFKDMRRAVGRIYDAIGWNERMAIHGDYDADGVAASLIIESTIKNLGGATTVYIPHREHEGYGLHIEALDYLKKQDVRLVITCDCGISNAVEIAYANKIGIDVIVTDHHTIPADLPPAYAILHPERVGENYPWKYLAGGGVAFKLAQALLRSERNTLSPEDREQREKWLLDLVAISTVADMVPLQGENRILTHFGLIVLAKTKRLGLRELYRHANIDPLSISTETISYQIAPRINAAGRMDHASYAYALLAAGSSGEAAELSQRIENQNTERQKLTEKVYAQAKRQVTGSGRIILVSGDDWPAGILGLVAGKLVREFYRPAYVVCREGEMRIGSGRGVDGVNVLDPLKTFAGLLTAFGGHPAACGFRFQAEKYNDFSAALHTYFDNLTMTDQLEEQLTIDTKIEFLDITWDLLDYLVRFEPFGKGNSEPLFITNTVEILERRIVGKGEKHVKLTLSKNGKTLPAIGFNMAENIPAKGSIVDCVYAIRANEWNGSREIQLVLQYVLPERSN